MAEPVTVASPARSPDACVLTTTSGCCSRALSPGRGGHVQARIAAQDGALQLVQPLPGIQPGAAHHGHPGGVVGGQRVCDQAGAVLREHELRDEPLPVRVLRHQVGKAAQHAQMVARMEFGGHAFFLCGQPFLGKAAGQPVDDVRRSRLGQRDPRQSGSA